jgi:histidine triad (HIT) family protein
MSDCIFCNIGAGTMKAEVVFESPQAMGFLDKYPVARGHVVVIPKAHAATLNDLPDDALGGLFVAVKAVMRQVTDALRPLGMNVGWNHGRDAGQVVHHLHVHVLPRYSAGGHGVQALGEGVGQVNFAELAQAIRKA